MDAAETPEVARTLALEPEAVRAAGRRRAWRVGWLVVARTCIAAAALYAGVRLWSDLERAAGSIAEQAPGWVKSAVTTVFKPFRDLLDVLHLGTPELLAAALIAAGAGVLIACVRIAWSAWDRQEVTRVFRREPFGLGGAIAGLALVVAVWGCIVLIQAGSAGSWDGYVRWLEARDPLFYGSALFAGVMTYGCVTTFGTMAAAGRYIPWLLARMRGQRDPAPHFMEHLNRDLAAGGIGFVVVTTALLLFPRLLGDPELVWPVFVVAIAFGLLRPLAARATAGRRAALRRRIIGWSVSDPVAPPAAHVPVSASPTPGRS